ncbi:FlgO family outer membrane protein [Shewanella pneumatophori]|uniref:FlgO domain-containing protein n=1 Tax=Shewanella pneumatophori TaxID=314092 RepID=A0A9X1ZKU0_9GAMM|nr:FlgO family outer membrane protein [Shewanella pneumatophori]MCL1139663.1 hypothetical protein [Shewanella pneumatophori]
MYKSIICLPILFALGCEATSQGETQNLTMLNSAAINQISQQMVNSLALQNDSLRPDQPVIVTTPVLISDLESTNSFGLQFQQGLIAAMHQKQFNLVDINVADALKITADGDFILTRDWQQLPADIAVEHVVVSTMSLSNAGMALNSRIVNVTNNRVVSAAQGFVNANDLNDYIQPSEKVVSAHGLLYRNAHAAEQAVRVIGER